MTKSIDTLTLDITSALQQVIAGEDLNIPDQIFDDFAEDIKATFKKQMTPRNKERGKTLYMSEIGNDLCKLWYKINKPELAEHILPHTKVKFMYGDIIESLMLALAEVAGHEVTDKQKQTIIPLDDGWEIRGYMDAKIDGVITDVKSASVFGYNKFRDGKLAENDSFGYIPQLDHYGEAESLEPGADMAFLVNEKQNGYYTVDKHKFTGLKRDPNYVVKVVTGDFPGRCHEAVPDGKSGNMKLPTPCGYCDYHSDCWKDANDGQGLRTFKYSNGPRFLTEVAVLPKVEEIT